jgi:Na+/H+-dicarboxylate symporter
MTHAHSAHSHSVHPPSKANHQTLAVMIALVLGIVAGHCLHISFNEKSAFLINVLSVFSICTDVFFRLIKMILSPLVFATLVVGMAKMGDIQTAGRIGLRALAWFFSASLLSLLLGMVLVNFFEPGKNLHLDIPPLNAETGIAKVEPSLAHFVAHIFPKSIIEAMANNEILQIVVFAMFFGFACASLGELAQPVVKTLDSLSHIMLKVTAYVMHFAPVAVFCALASIIAKQGLGILSSYGVFISEFYLSLMLLCVLLTGIGFAFLGKKVVSLLRHIREPALLAFGTASSESAYPKLLVQLERFGCQEKVCGFVLPMGYSFNLDGSMMYMTYAVLFIAQAYAIQIPLADQLTLLLTLLLTSKGIAGVPRASLVVIASTLSQYGIPEAGLLLLLGIDQILDMGRSFTNIIGNSIAAAVIDQWEKKSSRVP